MRGFTSLVLQHFAACSQDANTLLREALASSLVLPCQDEGAAGSPPPLLCLAATLISRRLSTWVRQMGQRLFWWRNMRAQLLHMHMCRHGSTVVSRGSERHTTHSFPLFSSSSGCPVLQFSMPKISCSSYVTSSTHIFCFKSQIYTKST